MNRKKTVVRILALLLGLYAAAGMCATAAALKKTAKQLRELNRGAEAIACEIEEVRQALEADVSEQTVRREAFRRFGMVGPEDVVFFDGG